MLYGAIKNLALKLVCWSPMTKTQYITQDIVYFKTEAAGAHLNNKGKIPD